MYDGLWQRRARADDHTLGDLLEAEPPTLPTTDSVRPTETVAHTAARSRLARAVAGGRTRVRRSTSRSPRGGTGRVRRDLADGTEPVCEVCRKPFVEGSTPHTHHVIPVSEGGATTIDNAVRICAPCHRLTHAVYERRAPERPRKRAEFRAFVLRTP